MLPAAENYSDLDQPSYRRRKESTEKNTLPQPPLPTLGLVTPSPPVTEIRVHAENTANQSPSAPAGLPNPEISFVAFRDNDELGCQFFPVDTHDLPGVSGYSTLEGSCGADCRGQ